MSTDTVIRVKDLDLFYGDFHALKRVPMEVRVRHITALIGPSGCGKSTLLRTLNRMNDLVPGVRITGSILLEEKDIYAPGTDVCLLRKRVGMVFQRPNPFPLSIHDNVTYGPRVHGEGRRDVLEAAVEKSLRAVNRDFVQVCRELDLFGRELVAIDGSFFRGNVGKGSIYTEARLQKTLARLAVHIDGYLKALDAADQAEAGATDEAAGLTARAPGRAPGGGASVPTRTP